jgi:dipeptidyl aminopeptidase/acylaminoacyl peptidase
MAVLCVSVHAADLIPIEDFARPAKFTDIRLSPDGEYVGFAREYDGEKRMCFADVATMKMTALDLGKGKLVPGDLGVGEFEWIGAKRVVIRTTLRDLYRGGWIAVDRDRKNVQPLSGDIADKGGIRLEMRDFFPHDIIFHFDDERNILVTNARLDRGLHEVRYPEVVRLDTRTGIGKTVVRNPGTVTAWCADREGVVRLGVSREEDKMSLIYREKEGDKWQATPSLDFDVGLHPISFTPDGQYIHMRALSSHKRWALYRYDPRKQELGEPVWEDPEFDLRSVVKDPVTWAVLGVRYVADGPRTHWLDERCAALQAAIDAALPGTVNSILDFTRDGKRMLVTASSDRAPAVAYVYDDPTKNLQLLGASRGWIKPEQMVSTHPIVYAARDGLEIHGDLTLPVGQKPLNLPLVVMPHGNVFGLRDQWTFDPMVQMLANRGYAVLQMNYRGSGGFGSDFQKKGRKEIGGKIQEDIEDATRWAIAKKVANPKRIAIMGFSFGGYSALYALGKSPDLYCCGISVSGITDWYGLYKEIDPEFDLARRYWRESVGDPEEDEVKLKAISPVNFADKITAPVLVIHGKNDFAVPVRQARKMVSALESAGRKPESLFIPDEGHGFMHEEARVQEYKAIEAFLAKHLGLGATNAASVPVAAPAIAAGPAEKS